MRGAGVWVVTYPKISGTIDGTVSMPKTAFDAGVSHPSLFRPARGSFGAVSGTFHRPAARILSFSKRPEEVIDEMLSRGAIPDSHRACSDSANSTCALKSGSVNRHLMSLQSSGVTHLLAHAEK